MPHCWKSHALGHIIFLKRAHHNKRIKKTACKKLKCFLPLLYFHHHRPGTGALATQGRHHRPGTGALATQGRQNAVHTVDTDVRFASSVHHIWKS